VDKVNERSKAKMLEQKKAVVEGLNAQFPAIPFFEDEIAKDEEERFINNKKYYAFVLRMGDFIPSSSPSILTQAFVVDYYSEARDDVDETLIDIISILNKVPTVIFVKTNKMRLRAGETDRFVDVTSIEFRRSVKYDGSI
jgi:hypothetical protein